MRRWVWTTVGVLAGVLNVNFLLDLASARPASWASSVVSDLSVPGRPNAWVYRLTDVVSAALVLALAVAAGRRVGVRRRAALRAVAWCLGGFAGCTILAAVVTETCATTLVHGCGEATVIDDIHDAVSTAGAAVAVAAMAALAVAAGCRPRVRTWSLVTAVASAGLGLALLVGSLTGTAPWFGWVQRTQIVLVSLWLALAGRAVDAGGPGPAAEPIGPPSRMRP